MNLSPLEVCEIPQQARDDEARMVFDEHMIDRNDSLRQPRVDQKAAPRYPYEPMRLLGILLVSLFALPIASAKDPCTSALEASYSVVRAYVHEHETEQLTEWLARVTQSPRNIDKIRLERFPFPRLVYDLAQLYSVIEPDDPKHAVLEAFVGFLKQKALDAAHAKLTVSEDKVCVETWVVGGAHHELALAEVQFPREAEIDSHALVHYREQDVRVHLRELWVLPPEACQPAHEGS